MSDEKDIYDLTIISGGPVGLFVAFYAGIYKAKAKITDSLPQLGGQLTMPCSEKYTYSIPGFPAIRADESIANLEKQMQPFQHDVCLEEEIIHLAQETDGLLRLDTTKGTHYSRTVISVIGSGAFQLQCLAIENAEVFESESIHYHVTGMREFASKKIAIAGGGDSVIDQALILENVAEEVSIVHRRPQFHGHEHNMEQLEKSSVSIRTPYIINDILKEDKMFTGIQLTKTEGDQTLNLPLDDLIINYGFTSSLTHLKEWGSDVSKNAINVHSDMSTNTPGIYAIGDICSYGGKVKLITTGFGEASTTVNNASHYLWPDARRQPVHSTSLSESSIPK